MLMTADIRMLSDWIFPGIVPFPMKEEDDSALVDDFLSRGREESFERLVHQYKHKTFRLANSVLGPGLAAEAEDLTQEVFIQVFRKLSTFRKESRFSTWLYRITYNMALERKQKARFRIPHQGEKVLESMPAQDKEGDPSEVASRRQQRKAVLQCLEALDEPFRTAIYLHYWMKCPVSEIAEILDTRPNTVKSYLYRARKRLARMLEKERDHE